MIMPRCEQLCGTFTDARSFLARHGVAMPELPRGEVNDNFPWCAGCHGVGGQWWSVDIFMLRGARWRQWIFVVCGHCDGG